MSLLMEALRKAEEAKRKAARQGQTELQETASGVDTSGTQDSLTPQNPAEDSVAFQPSQENAGASASTKGLDEVAFEFEIDENFGVPATSPAAQAKQDAEQHIEDKPPAPDAMSLEFTPEPVDIPPPVSESPAEPVALNEETIEWHQEPSPSPFRDKEPVIDSMLSLDEVEHSSDTGQEEDLEDAAAYIKAADLARLTTADKRRKNRVAVEEANPAVSLELSPEAPAIKAPLQEQPSVVEAGVDATVKPEDAKETLRQKKLEEARKRETVRAVFDAKKSAGGSRKRLQRYAAVAVVLLIPVLGGGYWVMDQMGLFAPASQYNIPTASYDPNSSVWPDASEPGVAAQEAELPDVTAEPASLSEPAVAETTEASASEPDATLAEDDLAQELAIAQAAPEPAQSTDTAVEEATAMDSESGALIAGEPIAGESESSTGVPANAAEETPAPTTEMPREGSPIRIVRSEAPQIDPALTLAYTAYRASDFATARAQYQQALRNTPNSRDALLGLAAVAMKTGDVTSARAHYSRLLELDPRDALARVGLLESIPSSDSVEKEGELRALFAEHPDVAPLAFALGNLLASQGRWSDAQQSYYDALLAAKAGGGSALTPDYAFNLAVSLERLNQLRPAYDFYREALAQAQVIPPSFDLRVLRERLDALERVLP